jgi:hypothetical protein
MIGPQKVRSYQNPMTMHKKKIYGILNLTKGIIHAIGILYNLKYIYPYEDKKKKRKLLTCLRFTYKRTLKIEQLNNYDRRYEN